MAPKKVQRMGVKQELAAGSSTEICVNGLSGKALANKVKQKLDKSLRWLRDYYNGKLKWDKTASIDKKQEFIKELINCVDPSKSEVFQKLYSTIRPDESGQKGRWTTWKKMCGHEDEEVLKLSLEQGKIIKRLHARLDHRALSTATLKETLRYAYKFVEDYENTTRTTVTRTLRPSPAQESASDDDGGRKQDFQYPLL